MDTDREISHSSTCHGFDIIHMFRVFRPGQPTPLSVAGFSRAETNPKKLKHLRDQEP